MGTAREHLRVARRLAELPLIDDALRRGAISYVKVRANTRVATSANEATLLTDAQYSTGSQLERICRKYAAVVRASKEPDEAYDRDRRYLRRFDLDDGMVKIDGIFHPEEAAVIWAALEAVARARTSDRLRGDRAATTVPRRLPPTGLVREPRQRSTLRWGPFQRASVRLASIAPMRWSRSPAMSCVAIVSTPCRPSSW